jgi:hypothetical protein
MTEEPVLTPEDEEAIVALQGVDPDEFALKEATAHYAAAACSTLVQSQVPDPDNVDVETLQQLFDQYAPLAEDAALAWMSSVDPSSLADILPKPNMECTLSP